MNSGCLLKINKGMSTSCDERFKTPLTGHVKHDDFDTVYEPAEDSFLLLDALEKDDAFLQTLNPTICVEIGCGSGICLTFLAQILSQPAIFLCTDINSDATTMAKRTGDVNKQIIQPVICNLADPLEDRLAGKVDVLVFNPPYVVTPSEEVGSNGIEASWAGGVNGREVIDQFLPRVSHLISPNGVFYLVVIEENDAVDIGQVMKAEGFSMTNIVTRRAGRELLSILKFTRSS